ncbi:YACP-LIKE NYN DOMAIN PROTEIN [Salix purpurea]|uniref:YACP-LIKE NYN DOMAIN PROTEIN n=1 Tax=Salix purpurea TaxID=77065 RepID=A0A9Q0QHC4_SALPP|nr:YACP-LIKE NYN DOMAIN PROTEIN [Salix purpurea]
MKAVTVPSPYGASSSSCHHYNNYRVVILMAKSKKSQHASSPNKGSEPAPPRITSNVKQNLQFLKLWKEFQKKKSSTPRPSTSYRRKKVEKEDLPDDTELYRDPTLSLYYTNQICRHWSPGLAC